MLCLCILSKNVDAEEPVQFENSPQEKLHNSVEHYALNYSQSGATTVKLNLENALGVAISRNFELDAIKATGKVQHLAITERWRDFFPTLSLSYMQTEESRLREPDVRQHRMSVDSQITVYDGGQRSLAYDVAKLQALLARNDYRIALNEIIAKTRNAYFQVLQLRDSIEINRKTLERGKMQLMFINKELQLGEATKFDKLEIEAKVKEMELNFEKSKNDFTTGLNQFKRMLRVDWRQPVEVIGDIENDFIIRSLNEDKFSIDSLVAIAVKNRKEVESTDVEYIINQKKYTINKRYNFPRISVGLNYSLTDQEFFPREKNWGVNIKATTALWGNSADISTGYNEGENGNVRTLTNNESLQVLNSMDYKRKILESGIQLNISKEHKNDVRQQIALEVINSYTTLKNAWKLIDISRTQLELYDNQLVIERMKANMGDSRRYDLIKKEIERGEAAIAYLNSLVRYLSSASALEIALGKDVGFLRLTAMKGDSK